MVRAMELAVEAQVNLDTEALEELREWAEGELSCSSQLDGAEYAAAVIAALDELEQLRVFDGEYGRAVAELLNATAQINNLRAARDNALSVIKEWNIVPEPYEIETMCDVIRRIEVALTR